MEENFLAVDVIGAFLSRDQFELAEGERSRAKKFQKPVA
jgi:hypothetical protein